MKALIASLVALAWLNAAPAVPGSHPLTARGCTAPPGPGRTPDTHGKASALAPSGHHQRAYGAPIPKPIVTRHAKPRHKSLTAPPASAR